MTWALQVVAPCGLFLFPSSDRAFGFPDSRFGHFAPKRLLGGVCCFDSLRQPFKILGDLKHQLLRFLVFHRTGKSAPLVGEPAPVFRIIDEALAFAILLRTGFLPPSPPAEKATASQD